MTRDFLKLSKP